MSSLFKRSNGIYYFVVTDSHGHRRWKSTGECQRGPALKKISSGSSPPVETPASKKVSVFFDEFLEYGTSIFAAENLQIYRRAFAGFLRHVGNPKLESVTQRDVDLLKSKRLKEVGRVTVNIELRTLRAAFYTAVRWKAVNENPFTRVKLCTLDENPPAYFAVDDLRKLLGSISSEWLRDITILAAFSGMRRSEVLNLRWIDVDFPQGTMLIRSHGKFRTKSGKMRIVPMNDEVRKVLNGRQEKKTCEFVFHLENKSIDARLVSLYFKRQVVKAGLDPRLHFHSLRHSFASWCVQAQAPIYQVQKLLGHSSIKVTEIYSHLAASDLRGTVDKLTPL